MGKSIRGRQRPVSMWRNVRYVEVRAAVLGLLLVWDTLDRRGRDGRSLCADEVERMRRALVVTVDLDDGTELFPPEERHDGRTRYRTERVSGRAPARDRAYALYDACCDFLSVFLADQDSTPTGQAWDRAGRAVREAIIRAPARRTPPTFRNGLAPRGT